MSSLSELLSEVGRSYQWGLRDALKPRLALTSVAVALVAAVAMLVVFAWAYSFIWHWCEQWVAWGLSLLSVSLGDGWRTVLAFLLLVGLYVLGVVLLVQVALELWLMKRIQSACLQRHPSLQTRRREGTLLHSGLDVARTFMTWLIGGLACLLVPVIGGALLTALSSYLALRSLVNDALEGMASDAEVRHLIQTSRPQLLVLGLMVAVTALIPLMGFLVPVLAGASTCHLMMGRLQRLEASSVAT